MDITPFIDTLRRDLLSAAEASGPDAREAAARMLSAFEPAMRLALLDALSQAAAEITADLPAGVVELRLRGRVPELVVDVPAPLSPPTLPQPAPKVPAGQPEGEDESDDEGGIARVTLRIPESVKARAEELAANGNQSLNAWIVNALRAATSHHAINVDIDLSSLPFLDTRDRGPGGRRLSGWI